MASIRNDRIARTEIKRVRALRGPKAFPTVEEMKGAFLAARHHDGSTPHPVVVQEWANIAHWRGGAEGRAEAAMRRLRARIGRMRGAETKEETPETLRIRDMISQGVRAALSRAYDMAAKARGTSASRVLPTHRGGRGR